MTQGRAGVPGVYYLPAAQTVGDQPFRVRLVVRPTDQAVGIERTHVLEDPSDMLVSGLLILLQLLAASSPNRVGLPYTPVAPTGP